jgi:hypothetical protein
MPFLVVSHRHEMIPFAYRLKNQGHTTELLVCTERFEKAWEGKFDHVMPAREVRHTENLKPVMQMAERGELHVLCDSLKVSKKFEGIPNFYGTTLVEEYDPPTSLLRLGGWWTGDGWLNPHLLVCDLGAWPGGYGTNVLGGLTLIRLGRENLGLFEEFISPVAETLGKLPDFRGLVQAGVQESAAGRLTLQGASFGWPFLQSHAYVSELENLSTHFVGEPEALPERTVTVVPVSLPPWPYTKGVSTEGLVLQGLTPKQVAQVFWHDVRLNTEQRTLSSGGLDGLLGVVRGASHNPRLARSKAIRLAASLSVPEKQFRPDAGGLVDDVLAQLEDRLGIVV